MSLRIANRDARRLWLHAQGLGTPPTGRLDTAAIVGRLGMVQLDTIRVVARAHHHILWSRNQHYRERHLNRVLAGDRAVFEHFTHDAAVLPIAAYPYWRRQYARLGAKIRKAGWFKSMPGAAGRAAIKQRIADEGPLSTHAFDTKRPAGAAMWSRPPHKLALDYMWYTGELATSHRENFTKYYDLTERIIPANLQAIDIPDAEQVHWLCATALDRLAFADAGTIMRFWEAADLAEVKAWLAAQPDLVAVDVEAADRTWRPAVAPPDIAERLEHLPPPTTRLRILSPFDPVIRDRTRLARLFAFDYRVEMFVPAAKRQWGYYVYPLLEGDRFVGRMEVKADRQAGTLTVDNLWPEPKVKWTAARRAKLDAELDRLRRFVGLDRIVWQACPPD